MFIAEKIILTYLRNAKLSQDLTIDQGGWLVKVFRWVITCHHNLTINNVIHCSALFSPFVCQRCCCLKDHHSSYKKDCAHNPINRKRSARHSFIFSMKKDQESDYVFYARRSLLISHHFDHIKMSSCKIRQHPGTIGGVQITLYIHYFSTLFQECEFFEGSEFSLCEIPCHQISYP